MNLLNNKSKTVVCMEFANVVLRGSNQEATFFLFFFFNSNKYTLLLWEDRYLQPYELRFVQVVLYSTLARTFHCPYARKHAFHIYLKGDRHQQRLGCR